MNSWIWFIYCSIQSTWKYITVLQLNKALSSILLNYINALGCVKVRNVLCFAISGSDFKYASDSFAVLWAIKTFCLHFLSKERVVPLNLLYWFVSVSCFYPPLIIHDCLPKVNIIESLWFWETIFSFKFRLLLVNLVVRIHCSIEMINFHLLSFLLC